MMDEAGRIGEIAFFGGDERQKMACQYLKQAGYQVTAQGMGRAIACLKPTKAARYIVLPVSGITADGWLRFADGEQICLDKAWLATWPDDVLILCGKIPAVFQDYCQDSGKMMHSYLQDAAFQAANAVPTAEGAIRLTYAHRNQTIAGAKALVIGFGHCGKALAMRLKALGAQTTVVARSANDRAYGGLLGLEMIDYSLLPQWAERVELVYNTVPALVLTAAVLEKLPRSALVIDLASAPGGTDFATAKNLGLSAMLAGNLPGRYFPQTAGKLLASHLEQIILQRHASSVQKE